MNGAANGLTTANCNNSPQVSDPRARQNRASIPCQGDLWSLRIAEGAPPRALGETIERWACAATPNEKSPAGAFDMILRCTWRYLIAGRDVVHWCEQTALAGGEGWKRSA